MTGLAVREMTGLTVRKLTGLAVSILHSAQYGRQQNFAVALDQRHLQRLARRRRRGRARVHMAGGVEPDTARHSHHQCDAHIMLTQRRRGEVEGWESC